MNQNCGGQRDLKHTNIVCFVEIVKLSSKNQVVKQIIEWVESLSVTHDGKSKKTLSGTRKRFEHPLLSQTGRLS